jgi:hypothetical protein
LRNLKGQLYINSCNSEGEQIQETDLEKEHWFKEVTFKGIFGKETFYEPVKGQPTKLKAYQSYVYRVYKVKAPKCPVCSEKIERGLLSENDNCTRLRVMGLKSGLYLRNFGSELNSGQDLTQHYMNVDLPAFHLIEERPIDVSEAIKMFENNELSYCACWDLIEIFENRCARNL